MFGANLGTSDVSVDSHDVATSEIPGTGGTFEPGELGELP